MARNQIQAPNPSDMPEEVRELLNAVETGTVGFARPQIQYSTDEGLTYRTEREAALDAGDFSNLDNGF